MTDRRRATCRGSRECLQGTRESRAPLLHLPVVGSGPGARHCCHHLATRKGSSLSATPTERPVERRELQRRLFPHHGGIATALPWIPCEVHYLSKISLLFKTVKVAFLSTAAESVLNADGILMNVALHLR